MAQIRTGLRKLLEIPEMYSGFQNLLGAKKARNEVVQKYLEIHEGLSILDVGCGPADILEYLPTGVLYTGIDFESSYIEKAKNRFFGRGNFICDDVSNLRPEKNQFDRIFISGVLHHLEDNEVINLMAVLSSLLKKGGFLCCVENVYISDQNRIARYLISKDRGQNVRTPEEYVGLCKTSFMNVDFDIRHNLLRIPYTHIIFKCGNL